MTLPQYEHGKPLILEGEELEKAADYVRSLHKEARDKLPPNIQAWPSFVLQYLEEQAPYVFEGTKYNVEIEKMDAEKGAGFGSVTVSNHPAPRQKGPGTMSPVEAPTTSGETGAEIKQVAVPVVIEDFHLYPMDVMVTKEGQYWPLTEQRYNEQMFRPTPYVGTETPSQQAYLYGQTTPSYDMAVGYGTQAGSGGMNRYASAPGPSGAAEAMQQGSEAADYGPSCNDLKWPGSDVKLDFSRVKILPRLKAYMARDKLKGDEYLDAAHTLLPLNVLRVQKREDGTYAVTEISDKAYLPKKRVMGDMELVMTYGSRVPNLLQELATRGDDVVITIDHDEREPLILEEYSTNPTILKQSGSVIVATHDGAFKTGRLFADVRDFDSNPTGSQVFTDKECFGYQGQFAGEFVGPAPRMGNDAPHAQDWALFAHADDDGHVVATCPFQVHSYHTQGSEAFLQVSTMEGEYVTLIVTEGIGKIFNVGGAAVLALGQHAGLSYKIPATYTYISLGKLKQFVEEPLFMERAVKGLIAGKLGMNSDYATSGVDEDERPYLVVVYYPDGTFGVQGRPLDGITGKWKELQLSPKDALFRLVVLGLSVEGAKRVLASAKMRTRVTVGNLKYVDDLRAKTADIVLARREIEKVCSNLCRDLKKEAERIADPMSVDTLLSLNFITPETLQVFVDALPQMKEVESHLAQLLVIARLGVKDVPEEVVSRALKGLNEVNEGLEWLINLQEQRRYPPQTQQQ